jgi:hypothetical protein
MPGNADHAVLIVHLNEFVVNDFDFLRTIFTIKLQYIKIHMTIIIDDAIRRWSSVFLKFIFNIERYLRRVFRKFIVQ